MLPQPIPVTVLTGFLGSGKTTLLNRILTAHHGKRIAVIENEYGEIGIDNELVVNAEEEIFEMNNGCICCTVRGDLIRILGNLAKRKTKFDYVLIETTGLADPAPVAQTFFVDDEVKESFSLDAIVTMVDAKHVWQHLDTSSECQEQIAFADVLILNKIDLVSSEELERLEGKIRSMNATCKLYRTQNAELDVDLLLNVHAFDLDAKLEVNADFLTEEVPFEWGGVYELGATEFHLRLEEGADPTMDILLFPLPNSSEAAYAEAKKNAIMRFGARPKAVPPGSPLHMEELTNRLLLGSNGGTFPFLAAFPGFWAFFMQHHPSEFDARLERDGEVLEPLLSQSYAHSHTHDQRVTSVGIVELKAIHSKKLNTWISNLLATKGVDLFRMKGILNIQGSENRYVFQGVHMLFDGKADRPWKSGEERKSQLVFIGRNLDRKELEEGFRSCLA